jgi:hypothetical protein
VVGNGSFAVTGNAPGAAGPSNGRGDLGKTRREGSGGCRRISKRGDCWSKSRMTWISNSKYMQSRNGTNNTREACVRVEKARRD